MPIEGVLREGEDTSSLAAPNKPEIGQWFSIDLDKMSQLTGSTKTLVELTAGTRYKSHSYQIQKLIKNTSIQSLLFYGTLESISETRIWNMQLRGLDCVHSAL